MARARAPEKLTPAVAYFRASSAANVGPDKDSLARQRAAVAAYAKARDLAVQLTGHDLLKARGIELVRSPPGT